MGQHEHDTQYAPVYEPSPTFYDPVHEPSPKRPPRNHPKLLRYGWFWEIMAMMFSFGCSVAVVAILLKENGQRLTHWNFVISLNATIAIFITAAKSSALLAVGACISQSKWFHFNKKERQLHDLDLFEEASRGPLGSTALIYRVKLKSGLAFIGSAATILALGVDTFAQQVVGIDTRDVKTLDDKSSFGLAHVYDGGAKHSIQRTAFDPEASTADTAMQGAVLRGLFNINSTAVFNCASRCTWNDTYISLGFTSSCTNVTAATLATAKNDTGGYNLTTPGGVPIVASESQTSWQTVVAVSAVGPLNVPKGIQPGQSMSLSEFMRFAIFRAVTDLDQYAINLDTVEVYECRLGLAAVKYSDVNANGNQFNAKREIIPLKEGTLGMRKPFDWYVDFNQTDLPPMRAMAADIGALAGFFTSSRFKGNIYDGESPPAIEGMGNALRTVDIPKTFENMATSMTDQLRSSYNLTATGLTVESVVFVKVQWEWLSLPLFVQLASALLLIMTMFESRGRRFPLWKSSSVAILYHELIMTDMGGVLRPYIQTEEELEGIAKGIKAKIE